MTISYQWLLEYLPTGPSGLPEPLPVDELSRILTSIGLEVEAVEPIQSIPGGLEGLVIGEVLTCAKHPNADKLSITTVDIGGPEILNIVCGAANVAAGQKVVVAPAGATVHPTDGAPFLIKKAKIRGEESNGMICAEDEIGLGKSHEGIMVLPAEARTGTPARVYFNVPETDYAIHIGLTPNRSDANSHIGVARDVCAYLSHHRGGHYPVVLPVAELPATAAGPAITAINIEAVAACRRYCGINIAGVQVSPSPDWLKARLQAIGLRSINNIVDITNYVLHESGQPLHAFDAGKIGGGAINVRFLPAGTVFTGLDEKERKLDAEDLVICDASAPLALGGVFGGLHSGITDTTTHVFLESAYFDPTHIRKTSLRLGLRTDAATHFEKGVDINNVIPALKRAANMITEIAGGSITSDVIDVYPNPLEARTVTVSYAYVQQLAGKAYKPIVIQETLTASGFDIVAETAEGITLGVPSNKTDVSQPADIVEEILRIDGLDNIEIPARLNISLMKPMPNDRAEKNRLAELLCGMGLQEIVTNSIVNSRYYPDNTTLVRMINSLSSELDVMRPSMLESGLEVVGYNCNRKNANLSLFEFGNVYAHPTAGNTYIQESHLAMWVTGEVAAHHWNSKARQADVYYLKGLIQNLLSYSGLGNVTLQYDESNEARIVWKWKNKAIACCYQVSAARLKEFDIKQDVYYAEIYWDVWTSASAASKIKYAEVARFPAVHRDIAIVIDKAVSYREVKEITEQLKISELKDFGLFDVFESEKLGQGKKSYALNYTFQLQDRTLTDAETEQLMKKLMDTYKNKLNAQIRE